MINTRTLSWLRWIFVSCVLGVVTLSGIASRAQIGIGRTGLRVDAPATSMKDLRDQNLLKQRFDYSCGAAALATLMRYGFGDNVTERQVLVNLFGLLSDEEKAVRLRSGFSLLDLQRVAEAMDYNAQGFRLTPEQLPLLGGPVIVFIQPRGYKHFAVLRGVRGDRVYLADPSRGNIRMPAYAFLKDWLQDDGSGIIFVVEPTTGLPNDRTPLTVTQIGLPQLEMMTAREMMAVGNPLVWLPELSR